jgi:hypothetical protein
VRGAEYAAPTGLRVGGHGSAHAAPQNPALGEPPQGGIKAVGAAGIGARTPATGRLLRHNAIMRFSRAYRPEP